VNKSLRSDAPSRSASRALAPGSSAGGSELGAEDWDAMVKGFLEAEIERTAARQDWLREKLDAARELDAAASDDGRSDVYRVRKDAGWGAPMRPPATPGCIGARRRRVRACVGVLQAGAARAHLGTHTPWARHALRRAPNTPG
jgi:hypothetical protein